MVLTLKAKTPKVPLIGRPFPDALLPVERRYAKAAQNYFAHYYHETVKQGLKPEGVHLPVPVQNEMRDLSEQYVSLWTDKAGQAASRKVGIQIADFIERPRVQAAIQQETMKFLKSVDNSVKDALRETLAEGSKEGETVAELTKRVKQTLGFDREKGVYMPGGISEETTLENWRASRIARTESATSSTLGEIEGWKESGVVQASEWVASSDACPFCEDMDGETMPLGEPYFLVGDSLTVIDDNGKPATMHFTYRPIYGPALHPYCRCALKAVLSDEFQNHPQEDDTTETLED